jgi:hypothetical protein
MWNLDLNKKIGKRRGSHECLLGAISRRGKGEGKGNRGIYDQSTLYVYMKIA